MESNNVRHDVPKGNLAWTWLGLRLMGNYTTLANMQLTSTATDVAIETRQIGSWSKYVVTAIYL